MQAALRLLGTPIVVNAPCAKEPRKRLEQGFDKFRSLFPAALCYTKIVPVDEVVTLTLYYREDDQLARLMLDEGPEEAARPNTDFGRSCTI